MIQNIQDMIQNAGYSSLKSDEEREVPNQASKENRYH